MAESSKQRAGRKGGQSVSRNREHMAAIGRKGGQATKGRSKKKESQASQQPTAGPTARQKESTAKNAVDLIKADHERVIGLYQDYETAGGDDKQWLAEKIMTELDIHSKLEEEIFYPAVRRKVDREEQELISEAMEEHRAVRESIEELRSLEPDDESFDNKVQDMMQDVQHHIDQEESDILLLAQEELADELEDLGAEMQKRRQELIEEAVGAS